MNINIDALRSSLLAQRAQIDAMLAQIDAEQRPEKWISTTEAAKELGVSANTVLSRIKAGIYEGKPTPGGGKYLVKLSSLS